MTAGNDFGVVLRRWRDQATPPQNGFGSSTRRRAPGMRRDELAAAAGVSAEYIKRLEQGRGRPSAGVLYALARALRLSRPEYEYLCSLAGHAPSGAGRVPHQVGPGARRLLDRLGETPVCISDAAWTVLAWNTAWEQLGCASIDSHGRERNMAWRAFTGDQGRTERTSEKEIRFQSSLVTDLRATALRYPDDDWLRDLVADLQTVSETFARLWQAHVDTRYQDDQVTIHHPDAGDITVDCDIMTIHEGDLRAVVFTAETGSVDAARLALTQGRHPDRG
ncbi:transcriptional regulator with XRE-family HTH domain [Streptomyces sp. LBL]|uniref:helix-turn-helix domain-containing protein n=1 Tax=Streptomyces sp. LBL TaxID=2940562 RepID=UPI002473078C|nr:helix-turn-helix domain-containing protein [Streptomyces sp. LBL]MDH6622734.1 transcriptional regulator with XRE-family HTH domain [Streptomyces sp. LBL]